MMADSFTTVDLSQLPAPAVVEQLDYEEIVAAMLADLQSRDPAFTALLESDPAMKILEVCAYRELLLRQRVNDAARAVMLAFATGSDLDHLAAAFNVQRQVVIPADPDAVPPTDAVYETDAALRTRVQLSNEGLSTAGPRGSYVYHGLSADGSIRDVSASSPEPGVVHVHVLSRLSDGVPSSEVLTAVAERLNSDSVRPLTDLVQVFPAEVVQYDVVAELVLYPGPDANVVRAAAIAAVREYTDSVFKLGADVALSGLLRALHQPGVQSANLVSPTQPIFCSAGQAARCANVDVNLVGVNG